MKKFKIRFFQSLCIFLCLSLLLCSCANSNESIPFFLSLQEKQISVGESFILEMLFEGEEEIEWGVSDAGVISIEGHGKSVTVSGLKQGEATVSAFIPSRNLTRTCHVTVNPVNSQIKLSDSNITIKVGEQVSLSASFIGVPLEITWLLSDNSVVLLDEFSSKTVLITGRREGTAVITAQTLSSSAICAITVNPAEIDMAKLTPHTILLNFYDKGASSYGITWHTEGKYVNPAVKLIEGENEIIIEADEQINPAAKKQDQQIYTDYIYKAVLDGLKPQTVYSYAVGDLIFDVWSEQASFETQKTSFDSFTFINITDSQQTGSSYDSPVGADIGSYSFDALTGAFGLYPDARLIVHCGDMVEWSQYEESWRKMVTYNRQFYMNYPVIFAAGNHETTYRGADYTFYRHFNLDYPGQQDTKNGFYYSVDYGNVHFTVINTNVLQNNKLTDTQINWLEQDLSLTDKKWKIVVMHNPIFSPAKWGSGSSTNAIALALREQLLPIFTRHNVDIVLQGHDHVAMDTYPIDNNANPLISSQYIMENDVHYWLNPGGVIFHMAATSGNSTNSKVSEADMSNYRFYSESHVSSYSAFVVETDRITVYTHYYNNGNNTLYQNSGTLACYGIIKS